MEPSLFCIKGLLILDQDGERIFAKYFNPPENLSNPKGQKAFEKTLHKKTNDANAEIIMLDGLTIVYRSSVDVFFYVIGSQQENELILVATLNTIFDAISLLTKKSVEKRTLLSSLDAVYLAMDEVCDSGIIIESDPETIFSRSSSKQDDLPLGDQTVAEVLQKAKEQIRWSLLWNQQSCGFVLVQFSIYMYFIQI